LGVRCDVGFADNIWQDGVAISIEVAGLFTTKINAVAIDDAIAIVVFGGGFYAVRLTVAV